MRKLIESFLVRWFVCGVGLGIASYVLRNHISFGNSLTAVILAGFLLAVMNMVIKPIFIVLSLPAIILTLGLFLIVINGLMVYLVSVLYPPLQITSFWAAIFAGMVIGLVNYMVTKFIRST